MIAGRHPAIESSEAAVQDEGLRRGRGGSNSTADLVRFDVRQGRVKG
jgi:hypothetical protein